MALLRPFGSDLREFDDLRRMLDAVFHRGRSAGAPFATASWNGAYPPVNLYEDSDAYMLVAELPGVDPSEIDISIEGSTVSLRGERKIDYPGEPEASPHRVERQSGNFRRAFELPVSIDADAVEATSKNGVLILRMPKAAEHRPRQIPVSAN